MIKKAKILIFCMVFVENNAFSQTQGDNRVEWMQQSWWKRPASPAVLGLQMTHPAAFAKQLISPTYYTDRLGYFCKQEIRFEKNTGIPLRFRLGTVVDCDLLEGKYRKNW